MNEVERQAAVAAVRERLGAGWEPEALIVYLSSQGLGKVETISVLHWCGVGSLSELKDWVHFSPTWQHVRVSDDEFHAQLEQAFDSDRTC